MPVKIDIVTNFKDYELTLESCIEMINVLQESYRSIRQEMYTHFLDFKYLKKALIVDLVLLICYMISHIQIFLYSLPIIVILFMISSIIVAEYLTNQTKRVLSNQIQHFTKQKELLLQKLHEEKTMTQN